MQTPIPVTNGDTIELFISGLGSSGEGVGKYEGFTVFVPGALPGERVQAVIDLVKKTYATAALRRLIRASAHRCQPRCPVYEVCGGCQLQHLAYAGQLAAKEQRVKDALERIGHLRVEVLPIIACDNPWAYRNKMQFPAARNAAGTLTIGCYAAATHQVVDAGSCLIQEAGNNAVLRCVRQWMQKFRISAYNETNRRGLVRHVMSRAGVRSGETMAVLITSEAAIPHQGELLEMLRVSVPGLVGVLQNINGRSGNVIMGKETKLLYGKPTIRDSLGGLTFNISAQSFFQVNTLQAEKLYEKVLEYAALSGRETLVDLYCGTGTISLFLARHAQRVYGVEIVAAAIADAQRNARDNACRNAEFLTGDAAEKLQELLENGLAPDVVLLDPPRAGCEEKVLSAVAAAAPQRIIYVSCNPASLARDLAFLELRGYHVIVAQPLDMFPMTSHVETVCLLSKFKTKKAAY